MNDFINDQLKMLYYKYGFGVFVVSLGIVVILMSLGVSVAGVSLPQGTISQTFLVLGLIVTSAGLAGMLWQRAQHPPILYAKYPDNISKVCNALCVTPIDVGFFKKHILTTELSTYISELADEGRGAGTKPGLEDFFLLLEESTGQQTNMWLICNAVELIGNIGILPRQDQELKNRIVVSLRSILRYLDSSAIKIKVDKKGYAKELTVLKIAMLELNTAYIKELVENVEAGKPSFYHLGTLDDPLRTFHGIIRDPVYNPARPYALALLLELVRNKKILRFEVNTALAVEKRRKVSEQDPYLISKLEEAKTRLS